MTIVTYAHRSKRPLQKQQAPLTGVVATKRGRRPRLAETAAELERSASPEKANEAALSVVRPAANDDHKPAIVTNRRPRKRDTTDMTPEEHQRRGDAADAMMREIKRRIAEKDRSD